MCFKGAALASAIRGGCLIFFYLEPVGLLLTVDKSWQPKGVVKWWRISDIVLTCPTV